jgi:hypothetical protein
VFLASASVYAPVCLFPLCVGHIFGFATISEWFGAKQGNFVKCENVIVLPVDLQNHSSLFGTRKPN